MATFGDISKGKGKGKNAVANLAKTVASNKKGKAPTFGDNLPKGGGGGGAAKPTGKSALAQLALVLAGEKRAKSLDKGERKDLMDLDLSKLDYNEKDLAKLGLDIDELNRKDFKNIKNEFRSLRKDDDKLSKLDIKALKDLVKNRIMNRALKDLSKPINKLVPLPSSTVTQTPVGQAGTVAPTRGGLANLDMSIFARAAVTRARGVRGAIGTSMRGDSGYGRSLARISVGRM